MQPSPEPTPLGSRAGWKAYDLVAESRAIHDQGDWGDIWRIDAEQHVTKQIRMHFVRAPDGIVYSTHRTLGGAFDALIEAGERDAILCADEYACLVLFATPNGEPLTLPDNIDADDPPGPPATHQTENPEP